MIRMGAFNQFLKSFDSDSQQRGKQFEHFVKWFLTTAPDWAKEVDQVWLWDDWPGRWGRDCGIDLVFRHKNGQNWAVQAKCYSPNLPVTKQDMDKFLSESNRSGIDHRLLIATTDLIGGNARQVCEAQEKPVVRFLLSDFERAELEYPANIHDLAQGKRRPPPLPREHQVEAIAAAAQGLQAADRGQLIMACGTGKTYTTLWIKEQLAARCTLVLVPSLGLLSQLRREWTFAATTPFDVLCVCSDQTVGKRGEDETIHSVSELAFPVTSDAGVIKRFMAGTGTRVVFSTYQSSELVALAQSDATTPDFDLVIADEAHRCAGKVESAFSTVLDNTKIRSRKRLFATATPRTYSSNLKKTAEERGVEVVGMDDANMFGKVLYALPFGQAIERKLLTDYRVVIIGVDKPSIKQLIANRDLVRTGTGIETDTESLATQIGLLKAIKDCNLKRVISFHNRVKRAEAFTTEVQQVMAWLGDENRPTGSLHTDFVSGDMPASKRKAKLDQLKALGANERGVLSNARCLSEGVDVPSLDGVAFIDPRSSQVDIIQAVGRAIRLSPDKTQGTIVLPVFIAAGENADDIIEASHFKPIWDVLNALKAHDDMLADELDQLRTELGRKSGSSFSIGKFNKITIDLPSTVDASFGNALRTYLVDQVTESWSERYGQLIAYKESNGDCNVPFQRASISALSTWCSTQRSAYKSKLLALHRIEKLERIGFSWNLFDSAWEDMFSSLAVYKQTYGDCMVPKKWHQNPGLAAWVVKQRMDYRLLPPERIARLDGLGFTWEPFASVWDEFFAALSAYKLTYGNCDVPRGWHENPKLATWCAHQRNEYQKNKLPADRIQRLEALSFVWNPFDAAWESMFVALSAYKQTHGDCNVPQRWESNRELGTWCGTQRRIYKANELSVDRVQRLEQLGFVWDQLASAWDEMFAALLACRQTYGECTVPSNMPQLRLWCTRQRSAYKKNELSLERIKRLKDIGFAWDVLDVGWEQMFAALTAYKQTHGDCNVPASWVVNPELGQWCYIQRRTYRKSKLSKERVQRLEQLGFVWELLETAWDEMFSALERYRHTHGDCKVPLTWKEDPKLGQWCGSQRVNYKQGSLSVERINRLERLDFVWDQLAAVWNEMFAALTQYKSVHGDCNVPAVWPENPKLGMWCGTQRRDAKAEKLSPDRSDRLLQIGFRLTSQLRSESV
jgi:superfamily II DNA or RNA helicase